MSWLEARPAAETGVEPDRGSLEWRASRVFKVMAVVGIAGIILSLLPDSVPNSMLLTVAFNWAAALVSLVYFLEARGIDRGDRWAIVAVRPLLVLLGAWGAYATGAGLLEGHLRLPFELALVAWAFLGGAGYPGRAAPAAGTTRRGVLLTVAAVPLLATMAFGYLVFGWGGLLDVHQPDLAATLRVDCGDPAAGPPERIAVDYDWSWANAAPLPNEVDTVFVGWTGEDAEGRQLYILGDTPEDDPAIRPAQRGTLGLPLLEEARTASRAGFQFAVDLNKRGYAPGDVRLNLTRTRDEAGLLSLTVTASYIHLGLWRTDATPVTCTWG